MRRSALSGAVVLVAAALASTAARAQDAAPAARPDEQFDFMNMLARRGLHDLDDERWNAYGQFTGIASGKPAFPAAYTNANGSINSLLPGAEYSFTGTLTLFFALRLWRGAEAYVVPEVISEHPFSQLRGLAGAIQNFELQKGGTDAPQLYRSQAFLRQTFGLGGERVKVDSNPLQLGTTYDRRRVVVEVGNFTVLDFFDKNALDIDPRQGFFSLAFLTYPAYDFASDARGYSWGGVAELYWDDWAVRIGRVTGPKQPNQLPIDFHLGDVYGDQVELAHKHSLLGQEGTVRVLGYRTRANIGRFADAVAAFEADPSKNAAACTAFNYGSTNATAPDLCWARQPNVKAGLGVFLEQRIADDFGVVFRGMYSDGGSEVYAYTSADRSLTLGALAKGTRWGRPADLAGVGVNLDWISDAHADYLRRGGVDGFVGDGNLDPAPETNLDVFYRAALLSALWLSLDFQRVWNPAFNAARGPVDIFGARLHAEF